MAKTCEQCGAENPACARFCCRCGRAWPDSTICSATRVSPLMQQWRRLKYRMTRKEVREVLGEPLRIELTDAVAGPLQDDAHEPRCETWTYEYDVADRSEMKLSGLLRFCLSEGTLQFWAEPDWSKMQDASAS